MRSLRGAAVVVGLTCLAEPALAQLATGSIEGTVLDPSGGVLPGATVTLRSSYGSRPPVQSDAAGRFRYRSLDHGSYEVLVALDGYRPVRRAVRVAAGASLPLVFRLEIGRDEVVEVRARDPVLDPRQKGTRVTVTADELQRVAQPTDVFSLASAVPGVVLGGVNVAGVKNDIQAGSTNKGANPGTTTYALDGVVINTAFWNGSPTYYDYGAFDEVAVTAGANAVEVQTAGVGYNFVTRRGTNAWHGSARGLLTHRDLSWGNVAGSGLQGDARLERPDGSVSERAGHLRQLHDVGFDLGGPILEDRLFVWGSYGRQDVRKLTLSQEPVESVIDGFNAKLNWSVTGATTASLFYSNTRKTVEGIPFGSFETGEGSVRDQGAGYGGFLPFGIHGLVKLEVSHARSRLLLNLKYLDWDTGAAGPPRDPVSTSAIDFVNGRVRGGHPLAIRFLFPLRHLTELTGSYAATGWGGSHDLRFGVGYRRTEPSSRFSRGGSENLVAAILPSPRGPLGLVSVYRDEVLESRGHFWHAYVADTFQRGRLTATAGLRFDLQKARSRPSSVPASPGFPELLPAIEYDGAGEGISWASLSPRVGLTLFLDEAGRTLVRASFGVYTTPLDSFVDATWDNPLQLAEQRYLWDDRDGDGLPSPPEVLVEAGLLSWSGHDPADPTRLRSPNVLDPDYAPPLDYELILGVDHELRPGLRVGAAYTSRRSTGIWWTPRLRAGGGLFQLSDYLPNEPVTANGFTARSFSPDPALLGAGGRLLTNRPDYHRSFGGLDLTLVRPLSDGWMARVNFSLMDAREHLSGPGAVDNPTRRARATEGSGPQVDGGQVAQGDSGRSPGDRLLNHRWQLYSNLLYELPAGFEVGATLHGLQGPPRAVQLRLDGGADSEGGGLPALAVPRIDTERLPAFWNLDLRLARAFDLGGSRRLTGAVTVFNVFNTNTVLARDLFANSATFDRIDEIPQPRILRLEARFSF